MPASVLADVIDRFDEKGNFPGRFIPPDSLHPKRSFLDAFIASIPTATNLLTEETDEEALGNIFRGTIGTGVGGGLLAGVASGFKQVPLSQVGMVQFFKGGQDELLAALQKSAVKNRVFHGSPKIGGGDFDLAKQDSKALYGPGFSWTEDATIASGYAGKQRNPALLDELDEQVRSMEKADPSLVIDAREFLREGTHKLSNVGDIERMRRIERASVPIRVLETLRDTPGRSVRFAHLDIKRPFDIDKVVDKGTAEEVVQRVLDELNKISPEIRNSIQHRSVRRRALEDLESGDDLYQNLDTLIQDTLLFGSDKAVSSFRQFKGRGREILRDALKASGFDGITHIGGARTGGKSHRVWIAFDEAQIVEPVFGGGKGRSLQDLEDLVQSSPKGAPFGE